MKIPVQKNPVHLLVEVIFNPRISELDYSAKSAVNKR
jgi:hypothetical protein